MTTFQKIRRQLLTENRFKLFKMQHLNVSWLPVMLMLLLTGTGLKAQTDEQQIRAVRQASNAALKAYDHEAELSFLTEEVLITTGGGTLLAGREALRQYIESFGDSKMYWVRTPGNIHVNVEKGLAWEEGTWKGYDPGQGVAPIVGGRYAAQWTRASGTWRINAELFVTLE